MMDSALLLLHAASTAFMTGLIWFVQVVHYPLMRHVGNEAFSNYAHLHQQRTGWIVGPVMLIEMITALIIAGLAQRTTGMNDLGWLGLGILIAIWLSTALIQMPQHRRLQKEFDDRTHRSLVRWNWLRTVAWSTRLVIALIMLNQS